MLRRSRSAYPRILNWMIEGCLKWQAGGLMVPQRVLDETAEYFAAQDILADWIETRCELKTTFMDASDRLFKSWKRFCENAGEPPAAERPWPIAYSNAASSALITSR